MTKSAKRAATKSKSTKKSAKRAVQPAVKQTVKSVILAGLKNGDDYDDIMARVQKQFPDTAAAKSGKSHIYWYAGALKSGRVHHA